jgi:hypothetical protein
MKNKLMAGDLVRHLQKSKCFFGVDLLFYTVIANDLERGMLEKNCRISNLQKAKRQRVFDVVSDMKKGINSVFIPLKFKTDCCDVDVHFSSETMMYNCSQCQSKVNAHRDFMPMGELANRRISKIRQQLHKEFDELWLGCRLDRNNAYVLLANKLNVGREMAHIGLVTNEQQASEYYHSIKWLKAEKKAQVFNS